MQITHWPQGYVHWLSSSHLYHWLVAVKEWFNNYDLKDTFWSVLFFFFKLLTTKVYFYIHYCTAVKKKQTVAN